MLNEKTLTVSANVVIDGKAIARFIGVVDMNEHKVTFTDRILDSSACKEHRKVVRADRAAFEDEVYAIQDELNDEDDCK